jgi:hypothetical protein
MSTLTAEARKDDCASAGVEHAAIRRTDGSEDLNIDDRISDKQL